MRLLLLLLTPYLAVSFPESAIVHAKENYAVITSRDTKADIIYKAANVVPSPQQYAWQKMEYIAFVHFGMNTFTSQELGSGQESRDLFNPTDLNCDQWARIFKEAGMKMAILTAKHHDGFCLWPSKFTKHSVKFSPWKDGKGDVVREFVNACRKYGLKVGLYLSPWDRNNPSYGTPEYNQYYMNQLKELLTNYGKIDEIWFDGYKGPEAKNEEYDWHVYYRLIRRLQPNIVISISGPDVRWVGTETGYGRDSEWDVLPIDLSKLTEEKIENDSHPLDDVFLPQNYMGEDLGDRDKLYDAKGLFWYPAETDVSIRPGWFYKASQDTMVKSVSELVDIYFNSVGKNSVLLLNVPPDGRGLITDYDKRALMGLHKVIKETFSHNFARNAKAKIDNHPDEQSFSSLFGKGKCWSGEEGLDTSVIEFILPKEETLDVAMLQEDIRIGQRIEKFRIDYWDGESWNKLVEGTTVGYKRLLRFDPVNTSRVRLVIEKSRSNPSLANLGLYWLPAQYLNTSK
ncbi:MAG TPA: alpha-L-fucosidase [Candidatus Acidoferrales bacterium]|nr:alpha-L-fucosidase [Candidatus Acidoferrales bacterium]